MHPSLLPKYRGPAPIHNAVRYGEPDTGVTIIDLHPTSFDRGNVLKQAVYHVPEIETYLTLAPKLARFGAQQVVETLQNFHELWANKKPQDELPAGEEHKGHAPKLTFYEKNPVDYSMSAFDLFHRWRALPIKSTTYFDKRALKITMMFLPKDPLPKIVQQAEKEMNPPVPVAEPPKPPKKKKKSKADETAENVEQTEAPVNVDEPAKADGESAKADGEPAKADGEPAAESVPTGGPHPDWPLEKQLGRIIYHKPTKALYVKCGKGWIAVTQLLPPSSHKAISAAQFMNQYDIEGRTYFQFNQEFEKK